MRSFHNGYLAYLASFALLATLIVLTTVPLTSQAYWAEYEGILHLPDGTCFVRISLDKDRLVRWEGDSTVPYGWRFRGYISDTFCSAGSLRDPGCRERERNAPPGELFYASLRGFSATYFDPNGDTGLAMVRLFDNVYDQKAGYFVDTFMGTMEFRLSREGNFQGQVRSAGKEGEPFELNLVREKIDTTPVHFADDFPEFLRMFLKKAQERDLEWLESAMALPLSRLYCLNSDLDESHDTINHYNLSLFLDYFLTHPACSPFALVKPAEIRTSYESLPYDLPTNTVTYQFSCDHLSELSLVFYFARVQGVYKLVRIECAG